MRIHREGHRTVRLSALIFTAITIVIYLSGQIWLWLIWLILAVLMGLILHFFRYPQRHVPSSDDTLIYAPADGKVVVIEEVEDPEYFMDKRLQISVFMSPLNVHVNWVPMRGTIDYLKYHPGKYLVAWHPKSSVENERWTTVVKNERTTILLRQIAGAVARRIVNFQTEEASVNQGDELGFIKFGSRVDILLPLDADVKVKIDDKVTGNQTILASLT